MSQPQSKRRRIALACDSCRARKTRCDGARPACNLCVAMDFECVYHGPVRNSAPGPTNTGQERDISHLESRLEAMERKLQALGEAPSSAHRSTAGSEDGTCGMASPCAPDSLHNAAENATENTVDGMGVITFADESEVGYFGPSCLSFPLILWIPLRHFQGQLRTRHSSVTSARVPHG